MKTLSTIAANVRTRIHDTNPSDYVVGTTRIYKLISDTVLDWAGLLDVQGLQWATGAVTLATDDEDYALATASGDYRAIIGVRRAWDGEALVKLTPEQMQWLKNPESPVTGEPKYYSLTELQTTDPATITMVVDPVPTSTENGKLLDLLVSYVPGEVSAATDEIPFADSALTALELSVSASVLAELTEEQAGKLAINPASAGRWDSMAARMIEREALRTYRMIRSGSITQYGTR